MWLLLRCEEPVVRHESELYQIRQQRSLKRWHKQAESMAERELLQGLVDQVLEECKDVKAVVDQTAAQSGDKKRWTIINFMVRRNHFDPTKTPDGIIMKAILQAKSQIHCKEEDITRDHLWARDFSYIGPDGAPVERKMDQWTHGALAPWVNHHAENPDHIFWLYHDVYGQHSAWTDKVIAGWASDHVKKFFGQALIIQDCLDAQWAPETLFRCWENQQMTMPCVPTGTSYLQGPDVGYHKSQKQSVKWAKTVVQEKGEIAALQAGRPYDPEWGVPEVAEVLGLAAEREHARNRKTEFVLQTSMSTQLLVYRPDGEGHLRLVDDEPWFQENRNCRRMPPSKGIEPGWAEARTTDARAWPKGVPPEPDWAVLDPGGEPPHPRRRG